MKQIQLEVSPKSADFIDQIHKVHTTMNQKLLRIDELGKQGLKIVESKFYHKFIEILDHLSAEFVTTSNAISKIDEELQHTPQYKRLQQQLNFFKGQCEATDMEIQQKKSLIRKEKFSINKWKEKSVDESSQWLALKLETVNKKSMRRTKKYEASLNLFKMNITQEMIAGNDTNKVIAAEPSKNITVSTRFNSSYQKIRSKSLRNI